MFIEVPSDINVGLLDGVEDQLRHARPLPAQQVRLEESLASREPLVIDLDDSAVRQGVLLHQESGVQGQLLLRVDVVGNIAQLLLYHPDSVKVRSFVEDISVHQEEFYQVLGDVPASDVQPLGDAGDGEAVIHRHDVSHTVTG